jgi:hypothetical protein
VPGYINPDLVHSGNGKRMYTTGFTSGTCGIEKIAVLMPEITFRHLGTDRVMYAYEQYTGFSYNPGIF